MNATFVSDKLKASLLQAAIEGKLTKQLPEDGDARDLLKQIEAEKQRLIKEKTIKSQKPLPPITEDEIPFAIPENWVWARLGEVASVGTGITPESKELNDFSGIPYFKVSDMNTLGNETIMKVVDIYVSTKFQKKIVRKKSVIYPKNGGALLTNKRRIVLDDCLIDLNTGFCTPFLFDVYFLYYNFLKIDFKQYYTGTAVPTVSSSIIKNFAIPLPPLSEQQRIVAVLETALAKIDKLKAYEIKLHEIDKAFPDKLKASLLQSAIEGKLAKQLPEDGNARDLLKQIEAEKQRLIKEKTIKREKPLPPITEDEIPFAIPDNWVWARLGDCSLYIQRGKSPEYSQIKKIPVISQKCVQDAGFDISSARFIVPDSFSTYSQERVLQDKDLLWNSTGTGTVGRIALYRSNFNIYNIAVADSHVSVIRFFKSLMEQKYIEFFIKSEHIQQDIEFMCSGSTKQKELNLNTIKKLIIPLPPLAEQHRIVEVLETALAKIDKLKKLIEM